MYHLSIPSINALVTDSTQFGTLDTFLSQQTNLQSASSVIRYAKQLREGYQFLSDKEIFCAFSTEDIFLTEGLDLKLGYFKPLKGTQKSSLNSFGKLLIQLELFGEEYKKSKSQNGFKGFSWNSCHPSYQQLALLLDQNAEVSCLNQDPFQIVGAALEGVAKKFSLVPGKLVPMVGQSFYIFCPFLAFSGLFLTFATFS